MVNEFFCSITQWLCFLFVLSSCRSYNSESPGHWANSWAPWVPPCKCLIHIVYFFYSVLFLVHLIILHKYFSTSMVTPQMAAYQQVPLPRCTVIFFFINLSSFFTYSQFLLNHVIMHQISQEKFFRQFIN